MHFWQKALGVNGLTAHIIDMVRKDCYSVIVQVSGHTYCGK